MMIIGSTLRRNVSAVIFLALSTVSVLAQQASLNLEGVVRDEVTGESVGCKIYIFTPSGKKISISSNSSDGTFLQTLSEAGAHRLVLAGYNVYRKEISVDMPQASRFRIIKQDLTVKTLVEGAPIVSVQRGFEKNVATLTDESKKKLAEMAEILRANQEMNVVVRMAPDEDQLAAYRAKADAEYKAQIDAWTKAVKKTKKGQIPPPEPIKADVPADPNVQLVQERIASVKRQLQEVKAGDVRVSYVYVPLPAPAAAAAPKAATQQAPKKGKKAKPTSSASATSTPPSSVAAHPTLTLAVGKVKKLYD